MFGLAAEVGVTTYKTYVAGTHLLADGARMHRYKGLVPKISPLAVASIVQAQARIDRLAKQVPLEEPWAAPRAAEWDSRTVADWLRRSGVKQGIGRELFDTAISGLMTGDLDDVSFLHLLWLVKAHRSLNVLFSIENGAQENLVDGGAGSIAMRVAEELGDAIRLSTPVRAIEQRDDHVVVTAATATVAARHVVVAIPPALILGIEFTPALPEDRLTLYRNDVGGPETKTLLVFDEPFWRADGLSGQSSEPGSPAEVTIDTRPGRRQPRCPRIVHVRPRSPSSGTASTPPTGGPRCSTRWRSASGPGSPRRARSSRPRGGSRSGRAGCSFAHLAPGDPLPLRSAAPRADGPRALGRHRDRDALARRDRRRGAVGRAGGGRDPRPHLSRPAPAPARRVCATSRSGRPRARRRRWPRRPPRSRARSGRRRRPRSRPSPGRTWCLPEVAPDRDPVAGPGMAAGERRRADLAVDLEHLRLHHVDVRRELAVPELTNVEVARVVDRLAGAVPAEEDVARGLHEPLALHDPAPVVLVHALADVGLEDRLLGLLDLEEQRIAVVATAEEHDPAPRPHAPDPDHLPGHVDDLVGLDERTAVRLEALAVARNHCCSSWRTFCGLGRGQQVLEPDDQRRVARDADLAVDLGRELRQRAQAVLAPRLGEALLEPLHRLGRDPVRPERLGVVLVEAAVPEREVASRAYSRIDSR